LKFWLGTHCENWLAKTDVPMMVSHRRLERRRRLPVALGPWVLDSGGFSELSLHGRWTVTPLQYVTAVRRYKDEVGRLEWAAPQDWMCEPFMVAKTGLSVAHHQHLTVVNYLDLRSAAPDLPFIPVLQGWTIVDYLRCVNLYADAGIDLTAQPVVGLGSVCRRQSTVEIDDIVRALHNLGINLHGFGVKTSGLARYGHQLTSADSMAWSYQARRDRPMLGCTHRSCANCIHYALAWRRRVLRTLDHEQLVLEMTA